MVDSQSRVGLAAQADSPHLVDSAVGGDCQHQAIAVDWHCPAKMASSGGSQCLEAKAAMVA